MNRVILLLKLARAFRRAWDAKDWDEEEHNRDKGGRFAKEDGRENGSTSSVESEIFIKELPPVNGRRRVSVNGRNFTQIKLPRETYARVMSEIDTWMTKERRQKGMFCQPIRNHIYDIIIVNDKTNDIVIVGTTRIK